MGPSATTRVVRRIAAKKGAKLMVAFRSGAQARCPVRARRTATKSGRPRTMAISMSVLPQLLHVADVEAVELFADVEEEDPEDERADEDVERDTQLPHQRHA